MFGINKTAISLALCAIITTGCAEEDAEETSETTTTFYCKSTTSHTTLPRLEPKLALRLVLKKPVQPLVLLLEPQREPQAALAVLQLQEGNKMDFLNNTNVRHAIFFL